MVVRLYQTFEKLNFTTELFLKPPAKLNTFRKFVARHLSQIVSSEYPEPFLDCDICDTWESLEVGVSSAVVSTLVMARNLFLEAPVVCTESWPWASVTEVWNSALAPTLRTSSHLARECGEYSEVRIINQNLLQWRLRTPLTSEFRKQ